jgi:hypothetical protein
LLPTGAVGRAGLAPTGKRRLVTAHTLTGHSLWKADLLAKAASLSRKKELQLSA